MATLIDPKNPDSYLAWPRGVLVAELDRQIRIVDRGGRGAYRWNETIRRLLKSGFQGASLADDFDAHGDYSLGGVSSEQLAFVKQLRAEVTTAPPAPPTRPYWSQRAGTKSEVLNEVATMDRFVSIVERLDQEDALWAEAFGVDCPDGVGDPVDPAPTQIQQLLGKKIGDGAWPLQHSRQQWSLDDFYDLVEVLHDLASWPGSWSEHNYGGCIGHPDDFSPASGQALYRYQINHLLGRSDLGVLLADAGEDRGRIVQADAPGLEVVVTEALEAQPAGFEDDVTHAIALYRSRTRDVAEMRSAVVALAGVLERHRTLLKEELLSKDEAAFFDIANNFDLRHRKADQRTDYDPAFLGWLFYWYLATVNLVTQLEARQASGVEDGPEEPF